ncbi:hypothetical protein I553_0458 [Mycobacterium xenopi 4042]|uniref:Uncharacterized protein n=1 Tax=Mycobacterium xenopi 4042 TaxID=1299334 RepID=X7YIF8_MYCXE|nr:hypothetical protein I553_0458 [Mycobacterium xenopi 4042]EUA52846.1 hypothetical protein I552_8954 [Mycobacterium xenopi 3993]
MLVNRIRLDGCRHRTGRHDQAYPRQRYPHPPHPLLLTCSTLH